MRKRLGLFLLIIMLSVSPAIAADGIFITSGPLDPSISAVTISGIPAYDWYHGCGPTAAGSIIGYYDMNGYNSLFDANGWDDVKLTSNVQDEISSPEHNTYYDPEPDLTGPEPPDTSIADFFHTSEGSLDYGWSNLSNADNAFTEYAAYRGYSDWEAWNESFDNDEFTWEDLTNEIDNNRPMMFLVDTDSDGSTDHFVPVIGYDEGTNQYACYSTWTEDETIQWETFQGMGNSWGIGYATFIRPGAMDPVPVPGSFLMLACGLIGLAGLKRKN